MTNKETRPRPAIGQKCIVKAKAYANYGFINAEGVYVNADKRYVLTAIFDKPATAFYVGYKYLREGTYIPESGGYDYDREWSETQAYLSVTKTVLVYCFKTHEHFNEWYALPEDVEVIHE